MAVDFENNNNKSPLATPSPCSHLLQPYPKPTRQLPRLSQVVKEAHQLYTIAFPMILTFLLTYGKSAISIYFMGHLGTTALAGGSLAIGFANITGYSILSGLAMGVDAISSQAYGAKNWALVGHTLQRTILLLCLFSLPIAALWANIQPILIFLGQDPDISTRASEYLIYCIPDLFLLCIINPVRVYLRTQNITRPLVASAAFSLVMHGPLNYALIHPMGLGLHGAGLATALADFNLFAFLMGFFWVTGAHQKTWDGWSKECLMGWPIILRLAIPNCISVCLEWWWYELMIILSGVLPGGGAAAVAAMGILIQATSLIYIFPSSLSLAVSTRVGNELGAGRHGGARSAALVGVGCSAVTSLVALGFAVSMRGVWGSIFTEDAAVVALVAAALPVLGLCEVGNCPQTTACGVLRGSARPQVGANVNLGSFYGVGLPVALILGFYFKMGLMGLWFGLLSAQLVCAILMLIILVRTNWACEAERARELTGGPAHEEDEEKMKMNGGDDVKAPLLSKACSI